MITRLGGSAHARHHLKRSNPSAALDERFRHDGGLVEPLERAAQGVSHPRERFGACARAHGLEQIDDMIRGTVDAPECSGVVARRDAREQRSSVAATPTSRCPVSAPKESDTFSSSR